MRHRSILLVAIALLALLFSPVAHAGWPSSGRPYPGVPLPPFAWPGQPGNPVGYAAAPGYPGHLTLFTGTLTSGTSGAHQVYSYQDFNAGTGCTVISGLHYVDFIGDRFQSNDVENCNVELYNSDHITFSYTSFTPLASLYTSPPGEAWPSAGAGLNTTTFVTDVNCINGNSGYEYGVNVVSGGPYTWDHADFWGFGNAIAFQNTTASMLISASWIHDAANGSPQGYHTDGPGYLNGSLQNPPQNVTVTGSVIASIGTSNGLAFQAAPTAYVNLVLTNNYLSGFGFQADVGHEIAGSTVTFTGNTLGTDIAWYFGPIYGDPTSLFTGTNWNTNILNVLPGTAPVPGSTFSYSSADNGKFVYPDSTLHTSDY